MTLEEFLASKTPEFREKVKKEHSQMVLQHAISRLRYEQNLTQEEVARKLQLTVCCWQIERNAMDVKLTDLVRYVNTLGEALAASRSSFRKKDLQILSIPRLSENPDSVLYSITQTTKNRLAAAFVGISVC